MVTDPATTAPRISLRLWLAAGAAKPPPPLRLRTGTPHPPPFAPLPCPGGSRCAPSGREAACRPPDHPLSVESFNVSAAPLCAGSPRSLRCLAPRRLWAVRRFAPLRLSRSCALVRARHHALRAERLGLSPPFFFGWRPHRRAAARRVSRSRCPRSRFPRRPVLRLPAARTPYLSRLRRGLFGRKNAPSPAHHPLNYPK